MAQIRNTVLKRGLGPSHRRRALRCHPRVILICQFLEVSEIQQTMS